jgi:hypothetical protein
MKNKHTEEAYMQLLNPGLFENEAWLDNTSHAVLCELKSRYRQAKLAWLRHAETPAEDLLEHISSGTVVEWAAIAVNPNLPTALFEQLLACEPQVLMPPLARHPNASLKFLATLVSQGTRSVYPDIARHPNAPVAALRMIAATDKREQVHIALSQHPALIAAGPHELIHTPHRSALRNMASAMPLNEKEFVALWAQGGDVRRALLSNPTLSPSTLLELVSVTDEREQVQLASNPAADASVLSVLAARNDYVIKKAVASNPNTPLSLLGKLSAESRGDVALGVAKNPATPARTLAHLATRPSEHVRHAVASHPHVELSTLQALAADSSAKVRRAVASHPTTDVVTLKRLAGDSVASVSSAVANNEGFGVVSQLAGYAPLLKELGCGAFNFHQLHSPKKTLKLLINSKHPHEIDFVFGSGHSDAFSALSALQSAHTNHKHKIDRAGYLAMLERLNQTVSGARRVGVDVNSATLKLVMKYFSSELIVSVVAQYEPDEARDTLRMLGALVSFENKQTNREHQQEVMAWLSRRPSSRGCFHNYLTKKSRGAWVNAVGPFYQAQLRETLSEATALLDAGWVVNLPMNARELQAIGDAQSHCVGGKYYADRCADGSNIIFQIMPRGDMKHGYTFQYSRSGRLLQAKGFANSAVPARFVRDSKTVFMTLNKMRTVSLAA